MKDVILAPEANEIAVAMQTEGLTLADLAETQSANYKLINRQSTKKDFEKLVDLPQRFSLIRSEEIFLSSGQWRNYVRSALGLVQYGDIFALKNQFL